MEGVVVIEVFVLFIGIVKGVLVLIISRFKGGIVITFNKLVLLLIGGGKIFSILL